MNVREALEMVRGRGDAGIDELAELARRDPQLAAQAEIVLRRNKKEWINVPGLGDGEAAVARDRGGREAFLVEGTDGSFQITGADGKIYPITKEYAEAMGILVYAASTQRQRG